MMAFLWLFCIWGTVQHFKPAAEIYLLLSFLSHKLCKGSQRAQLSPEQSQGALATGGLELWAGLLPEVGCEPCHFLSEPWHLKWDISRRASRGRLCGRARAGLPQLAAAAQLSEACKLGARRRAHKPMASWSRTGTGQSSSEGFRTGEEQTRLHCSRSHRACASALLQCFVACCLQPEPAVDSPSATLIHYLQRKTAVLARC